MEQEEPRYVVARSDSDWAADTQDRKSVSCLHLMWGFHLLKPGVATQDLQALSSTEAEFVAATRAASFALGLKSLLADAGREVDHIILEVDSSGSKSMLERTGLGRVRHLDTRLLWVQSHVKAKRIRPKQIPGKSNSADLGTKELAAADMWKCLLAVGFERRDGVHPLALTAAADAVKTVHFEEEEEA